MMLLLVGVAIVIGCLMPVQAAINAELGRILQQPYLSALVSFFVGTLFLGFLVLIQGISVEPLRRLPFSTPHLLSGGVMGALFVGASLYLIPKLGATGLIASFICGQLLMSVLMDHFGLFGLKAVPISASRLLGLVCLIGGLFLVMRKTV